MLINKIIGTITLEIEGFFIERVINICRNEKIEIWDIKRKNTACISFKISVKDFKRIKEIIKTTDSKINIKDKKGMFFFLRKYRKRKFFVLLLMVTILIIYISSQFVWNIEIVDENGNQIYGMESDLKEAGLEIGMVKNEINIDKIINTIRMSRDDIAWIGIETKGTNVIVKITNAISIPEIIDMDEYCDILSDKEGVITKINVQSGTANVKIGDVINPNDILVNGWMEGKYTGRRYVHAIAEIEAKVWYTEYVNIPYIVTEEKQTGEIENLYSLKLNNFQINFHKGVSKYEFYDTMETENKLQLFSNFYLPISLVTETNYEVEKEEKSYTIQEAVEKGIMQIEEEFLKDVEEEKIVNKILNTYEKEDSVDIFLTYEVIENIGINQKIIL